MDLLITVALSVLLFLALEVFWCRPCGSAASPRSRGFSGPPVEEDVGPPVDPFALPDVMRRLDALSVELKQLDADETAFAKAFHVHAAQSAHEALLAEAVRLAEAGRWMGARPSGATAVEIEIPGAAAPMQEELEV